MVMCLCICIRAGPGGGGGLRALPVARTSLTPNQEHSRVAAAHRHAAGRPHMDIPPRERMNMKLFPGDLIPNVKIVI